MAGSAVIGALRVNLSIDSAAFSEGLKNAEGRLAKFGAMAKKGLAVAGAAATAAAGAMAYAVKGSIDAADEMSKAAQKFGIPIEELSRLKYAADLSGVSFEGLGTGVRRLSQNMNDAAQGIGEGAAAFEQLGISVTNSDGSLKSASAVMAEMADRFAAMPDGAQKTALAMDLMGRSGADMIPLLNAGSAELNKLMQEADSFGQVFTQEMGTQAEVFNDNISRLTGTFGNLAARIATDILPTLERFTNWLVANAPVMQAFVVNTSGVFVRFAEDLARAKADIEAFVAFFTNAWDGFIALGVKLEELEVRAVAAVERMVDGIINAITGRLNAVWDSLASKIDWVKSKFAGLYDDVVGHSYVPDMVTGVEDWMGQLGSSFARSIGGLVDKTMTWRDALAGLLKDLAQVALSSLNFGGGSGSGGGFLGGVLQSVMGALPGFAKGGRIMPGGTGGIDSQIVAFRKSPSEQVDIYKPGNDNGPVGGAQKVHVTVGVAVDRNGNLLPFVQSISDATTARRLAAYDRGSREREKRFG